MLFLFAVAAVGCFIVEDMFTTKILFGLIGQICSWLEKKRAVGVALYIGVSIVVTISWFPMTYFILAAGYAFSHEFGSLVGLLVTITTSYIGIIIGSSICFYLGRYLLRKSIREYIARNNLVVFQAVDAAMKKEGLQMSISLRLVPYIPWPLFHYAAGMSGMRFKSFILGSVGSLPWVSLCAFLGEGLSSINDAQEGMTGGKITNLVVLVVGIIFSVLTTAQVTAYAKREFNKIQKEEQEKRDGTRTTEGLLVDAEAGEGSLTERLLPALDSVNEMRNNTSE